MFAASIFSITHLTVSRIGYGVVLGLVLLLPILSLPRRWAVSVAISGGAAVIIVLLATDLAGNRIQQMVSEASSYSQGDVFTSTGARLHMWVTSFNLWLEAPWFGHGTGAYHELAKAAFANDSMCQIGCFHPHNQFLFFAVDHGLLGVMLFTAYLGAAVWIAFKRSQSERTLFLAFLLILIVDALAHGPLWLFMESYFSFGIMALLASGPSGLFDSPKPRPCNADQVPAEFH
jgi:O-antigen ligase